MPANADYDVTVASSSVYHYHVSDYAGYPFTWRLGCYGDLATPVDLATCESLYDGCANGADTSTIYTDVTPEGLVVKLYCPCFEVPEFEGCGTEEPDTGSPTQAPMTRCVETNNGNCLSTANAGVACCDAGTGAQCVKRDEDFGQCKTTGCPYGRDPAWECETAAPTKAPTTSPPTVPPGSPSASPTTLTPTTSPTSNPTHSEGWTATPTATVTASPTGSEEEKGILGMDIENPYILGGAGVVLLIALILFICVCKSCCAKGEKAQKAQDSVGMKNIGSGLL